MQVRKIAYKNSQAVKRTVGAPQPQLHDTNGDLDDEAPGLQGAAMYFVFDHRLVVPEYIVDYELVRQLQLLCTEKHRCLTHVHKCKHRIVWELN
jgi:hypothetical protein